MLKLSNFIIRTSICLLVFLAPLFWLPFTLEAYEFNKQYLLFFLVGLVFLVWLFKMVIVRKKIVWQRTALDIPILVLMLVIILSAVFSVDGISSWLGFYGRFSGATAGFLTILLMYFVVVNNASLNKERRIKSNVYSLLNWFLASSFLVIIAAYFSILGIWTKIPWLGERLPGLMSLKTFNPMTGSLEGLAIFLAAVIGLVVGRVLIGIKNKESITHYPLLITHYLILLAAIILLLLIDFRAAWVVLGITMLILLLASFWTRLFRERVNVLLLPIVLIVISAAGFFGVVLKAKQGTSIFTNNPLPQEVILDYKTAGFITEEVVKNYPVLGSGPDTFLYGFSKFKQEEFNDNRFWNIRFDKGQSYLMELVSAIGILGILSYLAVVVMFLFVMGMFLRKQRHSGVLPENSEENGSNTESFASLRMTAGAVILPIFFPWLSFFIAQFIYLENTVLSFSFWLFTGLGIVAWRDNLGIPRSKISFSFKKWPEFCLVLGTIFLVLVFAVLGLFYLSARFYAADVYYLKGLNQSDIDNKLPNFEKAVNLNKYRVNYRFSLSQVYLVMAWREVQKPEDGRDIQLLQNYAAGAIDQARQATEISPKLVMTWENLGGIYRDLSNLVSGISPFAVDSFKRALELEPTNPFFYRELCRLNLMTEQEISNEILNQCQRAVDLKPNYLDAHIQLAMVYERKGNLEEAAKRLEGALDRLKGISFKRGSALAGAATEIYFQMGRMHFNLKNFDRAIELFEQSVIVTPQHANARYGLGASYQMKGRNQEALIQFQIVNQLAPGNAEVEAKINELSRPAL
ncbi:MAG: hypothetical protein A3I20_03210 [Candidatus Portnoybacteria bacterium RIFCSPLOWO2_02_FULL_40_15]|uniref:Uncharacterized protein n=1 Tax=Candidatus Portnoybacteria bacterium RIFCSPLOWO2_02_FULL_40_15 TaxID=1802002 RepID=A0A1G2FRI2_9BACT|nr:MAG: hypothetical protein A3I20_03210 [Candidatus Portnoybacteria bacterium RIFCSPLOWO2_02_FULL_40_15]